MYRNIILLLIVSGVLSACGSSGGSSEGSSNLKSPSIEITSNLNSVISGGDITLNWATQNVHSCVATGDWSGPKGITGSEIINALTSDSTFSLTCSAEAGLISDTHTVTVDVPNIPTLTLTANPTHVFMNGSTTLTWSSSDATDCVAVASGDWNGSKPTSGSETLTGITSVQNLSLNCSGPGGVVEENIIISIGIPPAPSINLTASPTNVGYDGSVTISWDTINADSCAASGDWSGNRSISGSQTINNLTNDSTFHLTCSGPGGNTSEVAVVTVAGPQQPTVNLTASPSNIAYNGSTTLSWNSDNANTCTASGDWSGSKSTSGSQTINALTLDSNFILTCSGVGGDAADSVNISVAPPPEPTINFSASPTTVSQNGSTTLTWNVSHANSCTASGDWSGNKNTTGTESVNALVADSQFVLNCSGDGGSSSQTVNITVVLNNNGTALLSWTPPTENTDGSTLNDLAGYKIYYGTSSGNYSETITINDPGLTSFLVENLATANWYFVMTSFNDTNIESAYSAEVSKAIN